jgi:topoisomerase-4 subunit B
MVKTIRDFYKKVFDPNDVRQSLVAAISIKIQEPVFESQTKTKLGSILMEPDGQSVRNYIGDILKKQLDNYLHMNGDTAEALLRKILQSEKERKEFANIKKLAKESVKKVSLHNKKLRDCRIHYNSNDVRRLDTTLFITEGDSASGSITKSRDVNTQAVFSLKGKPLNSFGLSKRIVYENEEFNLLQSALNIEEGVENLRYNNIVVATDADVDGMHIRLLLLTFFLQFYPDVVKMGHVYILQTPLFRVRNKKKTIYCYSDEERVDAIKELGPNPEITRFKGLGEISPDEFKHFIGGSMRLDPVILKKSSEINEVLSFYMGRNTPERQVFIIDNLRMEEDLVTEEIEKIEELVTTEPIETEK